MTVRTLHRVLNRGTGEQQAVTALEAKERLPTCTRRVLNVLCLVKNHILPLDALEVLLVLDDLYISLVFVSSIGFESLHSPAGSS